MTNHQGTAWETEIVKAAHAIGLPADRFPKRAQDREPDLYIGTASDSGVPVVLWKRLVGPKDGTPRKPDGERAVAVLGAEDFLYMVREIQRYRNENPELPVVSFMVQAKWTSALNVTRTLGGLRGWLRSRQKPV